jgi:hypothetical protein
MGRTHKERRSGFLQRHSLSLVAGAVLAAWIVLYHVTSSETHWGSFFGNAIADWTGLVVMIFATKRLYEQGSEESKQPPRRFFPSAGQKLRKHSLTIFLLATGAGWIALFASAEPMSKWGQVAGNIVSEWTQILGLVWLTKELREAHSKESKR